MPRSGRVHQLHRTARSRRPPVPTAPEPAAGVPAPAQAEIHEQQPRWATLDRKETRLRRDQIHSLAALRRQVARDRQERDEIITDNTLIRIAVDLLLHHADSLTGDTEEQLLRSAVTATTQSFAATHLALGTALACLKESDDPAEVFTLCSLMIKELFQVKIEASARAAAPGPG